MCNPSRVAFVLFGLQVFHDLRFHLTSHWVEWPLLSVLDSKRCSDFQAESWMKNAAFYSMKFLDNRCSSGVWWNYKTNLRENIFLKNDMAINIRKMVQWAVDPWQFFAYLSAISLLASAKKGTDKKYSKRAYQSEWYVLFEQQIWGYKVSLAQFFNYTLTFLSHFWQPRHFYKLYF